MIVVERCAKCKEFVTFNMPDGSGEPPEGAKFVCATCFNKMSDNELGVVDVHPIKPPEEKPS